LNFIENLKVVVKLLLEITDLAVEVSGKKVLKDIDLYIDEGETHVLLGPNGSGKSTLFMTILGFPKYKVTNGEILFKGENITNLNTTERVKKGVGVSFQNPPAIRGVRLMDLLKVESGQNPEDEELSPEMLELAYKMKLDENFLDRDVNLGFSGGEVKRSEILQLLAQKPDFIMFDEPDSGVDIENVELLAEEINILLDKDKKPGLRKNSGLLITHLGYILNFVKADTAHVLMDGRIACSGNPSEIIEDIRKEGFKGCVQCCGIH
jgi:Fe-S cluster assembly ATP-binding protein